ncbi:MAG: hypothetical protein IKZ25_05805 [Clostridia bacterium]|nr:hypothetical protein [Clostridia bacterium]
MMDYRYSKKKSKKKEKGYNVIYNQLVISLVAVIVILFSRLIFKNEGLNNEFFSKLSENISLEDLNEKVVSVFSQSQIIEDILGINEKEATFETDGPTYERA